MSVMAVLIEIVVTFGAAAVVTCAAAAWAVVLSGYVSEMEKASK